MARLTRRGAVLHPVVEELTRIVSPIPRCNQSRVQITSELVAEILDNASHGVLIPFGETGPSDRSVLAYLPNTIRSQSFSLSQRLNPT